MQMHWLWMQVVRHAVVIWFVFLSLTSADHHRCTGQRLGNTSKSLCPKNIWTLLSFLRVVTTNSKSFAEGTLFLKSRQQTFILNRHAFLEIQHSSKNALARRQRALIGLLQFSPGACWQTRGLPSYGSRMRELSLFSARPLLLYRSPVRLLSLQDRQSPGAMHGNRDAMEQTAEMILADMSEMILADMSVYTKMEQESLNVMDHPLAMALLQKLGIAFMMPLGLSWSTAAAATVVYVRPGSAAATAGFHAGDEVQQIGKVIINTGEDVDAIMFGGVPFGDKKVTAIVQHVKSGEHVEFKVIRQQKQLSLVVPVESYSPRGHPTSIGQQLNFDKVLEKIVAETDLSEKSVKQVVGIVRFAAAMASCRQKEIGYEEIDAALRHTGSQNLTNIAYHEAGHATLCMHLPGPKYDNVTIVPSVNYLGCCKMNKYPNNTDDGYEYSAEALVMSHFDISAANSLGGLVAEVLIFGADKVTMGARQDLRDMKDAFGRQYVDSGLWDGEMSLRSRQQKDKWVERQVSITYELVRKTLTEHRAFLEALTEKLLKEKTVFREQLLDLRSLHIE